MTVTLASSAFSLALSLSIAFLLFHRFTPATFLERTGIDLGMRLHANLLNPLLGNPNAHVQYAFVDVDADACLAFSTDASAVECKAGHTVPAALIAAFADTARKAGARVVVVDVTPPESEKDRELLRNAMAVPAGPWFIAPLYGRPRDDGRGIYGDRTRDIIPTKCDGRLLLASVGTALDPESGDGVVRDYPKGAMWFDPQSRDGEWVPTAAYLAARPDEACRTDRSAPPAEARPDRLFFSIPAVSADRGRSLSFYERFPASKLLARSQDAGGHDRLEPRFDPPKGRLADRIIVLGSSQAAALDSVETPLGAMSGAELTVNAIRWFLEFKPDTKPTVGEDIVERISGSIHGAMYMFPFQCAYWMFPVPLRRFAARRGWLRSAPGRWLVTGSVVLLRVSLFASSCYVVLMNEVDAMIGSLLAGHAVDLLTPTVALCLETFVEATDRPRRILDDQAGSLVENGLRWTRAGLESGLARFGFKRVRRHAGRAVAGRAEAVGANVGEDIHAPK